MEKLGEVEIELIKSNKDLQEIITEDVLVPHLKKYNALIKQQNALTRRIKKMRLHAQKVLEDVRANKEAKKCV